MSSGGWFPVFDQQPEQWMELGLCREVDGDVFFPPRGKPVEPAKRICRQCPVQAECLEYALGHDERFGVWGGLSEGERDQIKSRRNAT